MVFLGNKQRSFCRLWDCIQVLDLDSFVDYDGYSISSKELLPKVVEIMVIWVNFTHFSPLTTNVDVHSCHLLFHHLQFALIYGPNIPGYCAILLFTSLDFTSITSHIHDWVLFLLWLHLFILTSSILGTYQPGEFNFQCPIFFSFLYCSWGFQGKNTEMGFVIPFSSGPHFVRTLHHEPSFFGGSS